MNNNAKSGAPARPQESLVILREVSTAYERLKVARKAAAVAARDSDHTYEDVAGALGVTAGHAYTLINGRAPRNAA